ncbi:MAG: papain-like cysteine protease family protein [Agriterribacter sp.]
MNFKNFNDLSIKAPYELEQSILNWLYYSKVLNFNMETQLKSNWCWAATANSVSHFYATFLNPWSQCKIASQEQGLSCCNTPTPSGCNVPWYLDKALDRTHNYVSFSSGTMTWEAVKAEIDKGLVVGTRIGWSGGGGHFMCIYGVSRIGSTKYFHIDDPIYHKSILTVDQFSNNYQGSGSWTHSYITKKYSYMRFLDYVLYEKLIRPIPEFRPLLKIQLPSLNVEKKLDQLHLSMPHHVFTASLKDINGEVNTIKEPSSVRVIELDEAKPVAIYDLSTNENNPEILQVSTDETYLNNVENGIDALSRVEKNPEANELRLLRFPALNLETLWLASDNSENDTYFPVRHFEDRDGVLNKKEFNALVQRLKASVEKQDDLMGA